MKPVIPFRVALALLAILTFLGACQKSAPAKPVAGQAGGTSVSTDGATGGDAAPIHAAPESIRIASWNVAVLGPTKAARPSTMRAFAAILATFDLAALQEVGSNDSSASDATCELVLTALVRGISDASGGAPFKYIREGQYAFVYRSDRLEAEPLGTVSSAASFAYPPFAARFRTIGRALDFVAITAHTRPSLAVSEVPALAIAMDEAAMAHAEPDVICLGDFNADGAYYDEGEESGLSGFPTKRFTSVIPDDADTTVATGSLAYDRIILSSYMNDDWTGAWGVVKPKELVDVSACEGTASTTGTERALSDHYPVWLELRTSVDRD